MSNKGKIYLDPEKLNLTKLADILNTLNILKEGYDSSLLKVFKIFPVTSMYSIDEINLYAEIPSGSSEDTVLQVISGTGTDTQTTKYIGEGKIAWIESMGLEAEFSSSPDITWITASAKYIRIQRRFHDRRGNEVTTEARFGGSTTNEIQNWRQLAALSEAIRYVTGFKKSAKDHLRADFVAHGNLHYWYVNQQGDEYIKLIADAGIFTYTNDVPVLFIHGMVFDVEDIINMT